MKAEIIAVGSELLTPDRMDTNSLFLTERLNRLGIEVTRKTVVGDEHDDVRDAFRAGAAPRRTGHRHRRARSHARRSHARGRRRSAGPQADA